MMSIKQQGGVFGRNPTFNKVTVDGTLTVNGEPISDFGTMAQQDANNVNIDGGAIDGTAIGATTPSTVKASTFITYGNLLINRNTVATGAAIEASYAGGSAEYGMEFRPDVDDTIAILFKAAGGASIGSIKQFSNNITIDVGNGGGIDFSATSGTGTSELFDDYEEGTWTPAYNTTNGDLVVGSGTIVANLAKYTKIGNRVFLEARFFVGVAFSSVGTGDVIITGLPFASSSAGGAESSVTLGFSYRFATAAPVSGYTTGSEIRLLTNAYTTASLYTAMPAANLDISGSNKNIIALSVNYEAV